MALLPEPIKAFNADSGEYARYREDYPPQMIADIVGMCPDKDIAVDCATGTGQVASQLSPYFREVVGIDQSPDQIAHAKQAKNVQYRVESAEDLAGIADGSVDLITVATAIHWFDQKKFFANAKRVLKKGGVLAVFAIGAPSVKEDECAVDDFYDKYLSRYAPKNFRPICLMQTPEGFSECDSRSFYTKAVNRHVDDICGWARTMSAWSIISKSNMADTILAQLRSRLLAVASADGRLDVNYDVPVKIFKKE